MRLTNTERHFQETLASRETKDSLDSQLKTFAFKSALRQGPGLIRTKLSY